MKKMCDGCESTKKRSEEWSLSVELAKSNKRMFVILLVVICLWAATVAGFLVYLNQYDFQGVDVSVDSADGGNANYIGNDGDIYNGDYNGTNSLP